MNGMNHLQAITPTAKRFSWMALVATVVSAMALSSQPASGATVLSDTFGSGSTLNAAPGTPTASSTDYQYFTGIIGGSSSIASGDLSLSSPTTAGTIQEIQALFPSTTLVNIGDYIDFTVTFVNSSNILSSAGNLNSSVAIGLYNSGGVAPNQGPLATGTNSPLTSAGAQNWQGYAGIVLASSSSNRIVARTNQTVGATSNNQDLLFNNASSSQTFNSPVGTLIANKSDTAANVTLANGTTNTLELIVKLAGTGPNTVTVSNIFYSGAGTGGTILFQSGSLATAAATLTTTFDGLSVGWRQNNPSAPISTMDIQSILITTNIPEPSTMALAGAGIGLLLAAVRRRRS